MCLLQEEVLTYRQRRDKVNYEPSAEIMQLRETHSQCRYHTPFQPLQQSMNAIRVTWIQVQLEDRLSDCAADCRASGVSHCNSSRALLSCAIGQVERSAEVEHDVHHKIEIKQHVDEKGSGPGQTMYIVKERRSRAPCVLMLRVVIVAVQQ